MMLMMMIVMLMRMGLEMAKSWYIKAKCRQWNRNRVNLNSAVGQRENAWCKMQILTSMDEHWHWSREDVWVGSKDGMKSHRLALGISISSLLACTRPWQALSSLLQWASFTIYRLIWSVYMAQLCESGKTAFQMWFSFLFFFDHRLLTHNALIQRPNKDGHNLTWGEMQHPATHQLSLFPSVFGFRCLVASCHAKRRLRKPPRSKKQSSTSRGNIKRSMEIGGSGTSNQLTGSLSEVNDWVTSAP